MNKKFRFLLSGFLILVIVGLFIVSGKIQAEELQGLNETKQTIIGLLHGGNTDTLRVLYLGNSRVARHTGYPYDGVEEIVFEQGRLAGNGFTVPLRGVGQQPEDQIYLRNSGFGNTFTTEEWKAQTPEHILYSHGSRPGLLLIPGREYQMAYLENNISLLPKNEPVILTVQYLLGALQGEFDVTPIEVLDDGEIVYRHESIRVNANLSSFPPTSPGSNLLGNRIMYKHIEMPALNNASLNRAFLLTGVFGESVVYRVNVVREVSEGVSVSEMGIGGMGFGEQSSNEELPAKDWTTYARAYNPGIAIWQFAANGESVDVVINGSKKLMDRVESVNRNVVHIIIIDNPTPDPNYASRVQKSRDWAAAVEGYHGAIVIDPIPFLPQEFLDTAGQGEAGWGIYFNDNIHETRLGARVVTDAIWDALQDWVDNN